MESRPAVTPLADLKKIKTAVYRAILTKKPRLSGGVTIYTTVEGANRVDIPATMDVTVSALQNSPGQSRTNLVLGQLSSLIVRLGLHHP